MQTNGIIRRIDDLGRIVIPREYRRLYSIEVGDPMEISAKEGEILIKKVDTAHALIKNAQKILPQAKSKIHGALLLFDKRELLYCFGEKIDGLFEKTPLAVQKCMSELSVVSVDGGVFGDLEGYNATVYPSHSNGDCFGALTHIYEGGESETEQALLSLSASVIAEYMQKY